MPTLLVTPAELAGDSLAVTGEPYRHLFRAARLAVGERLRVVDGEGGARHAEVASVDRQRGQLRLREPALSLEPDIALELLVAAPRPQRAAWLVEKATELGCSAVRFVVTERSVRSFGSQEIERLRRVARAAVEQCGRARLPAVSGTHQWAELDALLALAATSWVLDPGPDEAAPAGRLGTPPAGSRAALLVGPEGGWSAAERQALAARGCRPLSLGPRVLRVETAVVAGTALVLQGLG